MKKRCSWKLTISTVPPSLLGLEVTPQEWELLREMGRISAAARFEPDARIAWLKGWIRDHLCPQLGQPGAGWNGERLLIFTEYADTKRWLETQINELIAGSDQEEQTGAHLPRRHPRRQAGGAEAQLQQPAGDRIRSGS